MPSCAIFWWAKLQIASGTFFYPGTNLRRVALRPGQNTPTQQYACDWSKTNKCHHLSVDYVNFCQFTTAVDLDMLNQRISSYRRPERYLTHQKSSKDLQWSAAFSNCSFAAWDLSFKKNHVSIFGILWIEKLRCPRRSASTSRCICSSFACNLGTELGLADPDPGALKIMHPLNCLCLHLTLLWETLICTLQPA